MTLAIAVQCPYGRLRGALESLSKIRPLRKQEAIIFLTDSRWTFPDHYEDNGIKLHNIGINTVIAYSGNCNIAEHCIDNLKRKIDYLPSRRMVSIVNTFRRIYDFHKRHNDKNDVRTSKLSFLVGSYLVRTGETKIYLLESPDFRSKIITGIEGIGDENAYKEIEKIVIPQLNDLSNYSRNEKDYFNIAAIVANAMYFIVIKNTRFDTVAGPIQFWLLNSSGINENQLSYTSDPTGKLDQWHRVTAERDELTTFKKRFNLGPDYLPL
jgi:hypothetical protein